MTKSAPTNVAAYLRELKGALNGAPSALIRDALADAEEFLRSEIAQSSGKSEAEILALAIENYGTPIEIAEEYRAMESTLSGPFPQSDHGDRKGSWGFGIILDPTAYGALLYMLLSLATGVFYFTWTIVGLSLMPVMLLLVIGLPLALIFIGSVRLLALMEGRIVEGLLGVRMPRRLPPDTSEGLGFWGRVKELLTDARTWTSLLYLLLMLPLGILYFTLATVLLSFSVAVPGIAVYELVTGGRDIQADGWAWGEQFFNSAPGLISLIVIGILFLFVTLNVAKAVGWVHARIAEVLLAKI